MIAKRPVHVRKARLPGARWQRLVVGFIGLCFVMSCGGSGGMGCGTLGKLKGGYPVAKRVDSAISLRVSKGIFDFLTANGAAILGPLLPADGVPVPSTCTGDNQICCGQTCKVKVEYSSLTFAPKPPTTTTVTFRAKLKTDPTFNAKIKGVGNCTLSFDTTHSGAPDFGLAIPMNTIVDPDTKLTNITFDTANIDLQDLDTGDISLGGDTLCKLAGVFKSLFISAIEDAIKKALAAPLSGLLCQKCATNDDCSSLADGGCAMDKKVCMHKGVCMQKNGVEGRIDLSSLLGSLPGGPTSAAIDMYAVAGSYADVEAAPTGGMSLGMMGGSLAPFPSSCVPPRAAPTRPMPLAKTAAYAGNTAPNGKPYHFGLGVSSLELDTLGHSFYTTGGLCLAIGTDQVALLSSDLLSALIPSLADLTRGANASLQIVVRPQNPPTFALGKGTFKVDGMGKKTIDDPLMSLQAKDLALDFYVYIDDRMVRFMRHTADLNIPLGLDIDGMGQIVPILGDLSAALSNVRVTDSALLKESPAQLSTLLPSLLPLLLGSLSSGISPIKLPDVLGMKLVPVQFTSTADGGGKLAYMGLFLALQQAMPLSADAVAQALDSSTAPASPLTSPVAVPVETYADLVSLEVPTQKQIALSLDADYAQRSAVRATLQLDAKAATTDAAIEWQYRVDIGLWRPFDDKRQLVVDDPSLRLPGHHVIEVRARQADNPYTLDPTPARIEFLVAPALDAPVVAASDKTEVAQGGCDMSGGRRGGIGGLGLLLIGLLTIVGLARRRPGRYTLLSFGLLGGILGLATGAACNSDDTGGDNNNNMMMDSNKPHPEFSPFDEVGRYQSAAIVSGKIYISAYNSSYGDLAYTSVGFDDAVSAKLAWLPVDGLPAGDPQKTDKDSYRGGYEDAGDDVGRYTAMAMTTKGLPVIAYQDVTNGAVKLAQQTDPQAMTWQVSTLTSPAEGKAPGFFNTIILDGSDVPTVAYMVQGVKKDDGSRVAQLVVATAQSSNPVGTDGWSKKVLAEAASSCGGMCEANEACVYSDPKVKNRLATVCKPVEKTCSPSCKSGTACIAMACVDALGTPPATEPDGTGLYARLVQSNGTSYLLFRDRNAGALKMASSPDWKITTLDGGDGKTNVGQSIGVAAASDGTLHVAYGNSNHQVMYRTVKDGMLGKIETLDDGTRMVGGSPESHLVGGGIYLFLDSDQPVVAYQDETAGSLEVSRRSGTAWMHQTISADDMKSRGYFPQAVNQDSRWLILDVVYDRNADALSTVAFSPL